MLNLAVHLKLAGASMIALALLHFAFPRRFEWKKELASLSLLNRQIFVVHCFFIALTVGLMGVLALVFTDALLAPSRLAQIVTAGLAIFWTIRLAVQWLIYSPELWRGHRFNTAMHILFTAVWIYYAAVFAATLALQIRAR